MAALPTSTAEDDAAGTAATEAGTVTVGAGMAVAVEAGAGAEVHAADMGAERNADRVSAAARAGIRTLVASRGVLS